MKILTYLFIDCLQSFSRLEYSLSSSNVLLYLMSTYQLMQTKLVRCRYDIQIAIENAQAVCGPPMLE